MGKMGILAMFDVGKYRRRMEKVRLLALKMHEEYQ